MLESVVEEEAVAAAVGTATTLPCELEGQAAATTAIENDMERITSTSTIQGSDRSGNHSNSQDGAGGRRQRADPPAARLYEDYKADSFDIGPQVEAAAVTIEPSHDLALTTVVVALVSDLKYSNHCNHTVATATTDATRPTYKDQVQPVPLWDRQQKQPCLPLVPVARAVHAAELQPERNSNIVEDDNNTMGHQPAVWAQIATTEQPVDTVADDAANHDHNVSAQCTAHCQPPVDAFPAKNRQDEDLYYAAILQSHDKLNGIRPQPQHASTDPPLDQDQQHQSPSHVPMLPRHLLYIVQDVPAIHDNIHLVKATNLLHDCTNRNHDVANRDNSESSC